MMSAVIYLGVIVLLEAWPVYLFLQGGLRGEAGVSAVPLALGVAGAAVVTAGVIVFPLRAGVRRVRSIDF